MLFERWFTNKCEALVDNSGRALKGDALVEAMRKGNAHHCGNLVVIGAKICNKCGAPAPGSWWNCKQCGRRIGSESRYCPHCGADQDLELRQDLVNGIWNPDASVFAERFELNNYRRAMENGLQVQTGQVAILLDGGDVASVLLPGHYPLADVADFSTADETGKSRSVFFVKQGEMDFPLRLSGLLSKEDMPVELTLVAAIQFNTDQAKVFLQNLLSNSAYVEGGPLGVTITLDSLAFNLLLVEAELAAKDFCNRHTVDELFKDPALRLELENSISTALSQRVNSFGFKLIRISEVEFHGEIFERLRKTSTGIEIMRRELEYQLRADAFVKDHEKRANMDDMEQEKYLRQLAQEMKISDFVRDQELVRLKEQNEQERRVAELELKFIQARKQLTDMALLEKLEEEHKQELLDIVQDNEMARKEKEHEARLAQALKEQQNALDKAKLQSEIEHLKSDEIHNRTMQMIAEQREAEEIKAKELMNKVNALNAADIKTLVFLAKTPADKEMLLELYEMSIKATMTPEQMTAYGASKGISTATEAINGAKSRESEWLREERERLLGIMKDNQMAVERIIQLLAHNMPPQQAGSTTQIIHN